MSYLVLARKYRPQTFASILGQEHISKALANSIIRERVPHAFLFTGPRGVGKTTSARIIAKALNCTGREIPTNLGELDEADARNLVEPCGKCSNCLQIARSSSIAVWEIDGASNNSVENIRELIDSLRSLPPPGSRYKIYIIDEVHMLSTAAFNALLKSLEEPPSNTIFIFATTELHKIPETVISRCQIFDFRKLPTTTIVEHLKEIANSESIVAEDAVFELIARRARGGMRDAQSMFDRLSAFSHQTISLTLAHQVFSVVDKSILFELSSSVATGDSNRCVELLDGIFSQSIDLKTFVGDLVEHWRNLLLISTLASSTVAAPKAETFKLLEISQAEVSEFKELAKLFASGFDLQRMFDAVLRMAQDALHSNYPRYILEAGFIKLSSMPSLKPLAEIIFGLESKINARQSLVSEAKSNNQEVAANASANEKKKSSVGAGFDPSWEDFINHVKSRSEFVLAAYLRRVSVRQFKQGVLEVEANKFDVDALKDSETNEGLKSCLYSYSSNNKWELKIEQQNSQSIDTHQSPNAENNGSGTSRVAASIGVPGSIAMQEYEADKQRSSRIREEAKRDPIVVEALKTFVGSKIEKVSILK